MRRMYFTSMNVSVIYMCVYKSICVLTCVCMYTVVQMHMCVCMFLKSTYVHVHVSAPLSEKPFAM